MGHESGATLEDFLCSNDFAHILFLTLHNACSPAMLSLS